jgi:Nucleotidyl transferase AbiEii toxin, Type IV TA system
MQEFSPRLEILPASQRRLWTELATVPHEFVLYGGTALALHLGHRSSVDFNFFGSSALEQPALETGISFLAGAKVIQRDTNTPSLIVDRGGPVKVSFFGVPNLPRLAPPHVAKDNGLQVASLLDLAGTKASVVQLRAEAKDYDDIDALMTLGNIGLPTALAAAQKLYGPSFNPQITLKALSYFDDGNLHDLPDRTKRRLVAAAREVDLDHLPTIDSAFQRKVRDHGIEP